MDTTSAISEVRFQLSGRRLMSAFIMICTAERVASKATVYDATNATEFDLENSKHRGVIRRAIRFLQSQGALQDWVIDDVMPETLTPALSEVS